MTTSDDTVTICFNDVKETIRTMFEVMDEEDQLDGYEVIEIAICVQDGIDFSDPPGTSFRWADLCLALDQLTAEGVLTRNRILGTYKSTPQQNRRTAHA